MKINVIKSPACLKDNDLKGWQCIVVDVLRATSTITTALVNGAAEVRPCLTIEEAKASVVELPRDSYLLGGEEMGEKIPGFDLGNSPFEYLEGTVKGKALYFYTTNGSGAIRRAFDGSATPVYIAALLNVSAVSEALVRTAHPGAYPGICILCSGSQGEPSEEDSFCAGLIVDALSREFKAHNIVPVLTEDASAVAGDAVANRGHSLDILRSTIHGWYLDSIGFGDDLVFASRIDFYKAVPVFDGQRITLRPLLNF